VLRQGRSRKDKFKGTESREVSGPHLAWVWNQSLWRKLVSEVLDENRCKWLGPG